MPTIVLRTMRLGEIQVIEVLCQKIDKSGLQPGSSGGITRVLILGENFYLKVLGKF